MTQDQDCFIWVLFKRLRDWHFPLAPEDYQSLYDALSAGFGWGSLSDLRFLCAALWAKSREEQEILFSLFDRVVDEFGWIDWRLPESPVTAQGDRATPVSRDAVTTPQSTSMTGAIPADTQKVSKAQDMELRPTTEALELRPQPEAPGVSVNALLSQVEQFSHAHLILSPRYVLSYRQVAQAWRRLRRFVRTGPRTELDIQASIDLRSRQGVVSPLVLRSPQRNAVRLLLLLDRQGSMVPFHRFTDDAIRAAIYETGRFERAATYYFHDVPRGKRDVRNTALIKRLANRLFPGVDEEVGNIQALQDGYLYQDPRLLHARSLSEVLTGDMASAVAVIVSDAGAARGAHDTARLVDTVAFLKTLYAHASQVVWLNPLPEQRWRNSSAAGIARYVPMFPVDREGLYHAVDVLRGQIFDLEYSL